MQNWKGLWHLPRLNWAWLNVYSIDIESSQLKRGITRAIYNLELAFTVP